MFRPYTSFVRFNSTIAVSDTSKILKQLSGNKNFKELWANKASKPVILEPNQNDDFNALTTLPMPLGSKDSIVQAVALENPHLKSGSASLKFKQNIGYVKKLFGFYKLGIKNVINNRSLVKEIKNKYFVENVEVQGAIVKRQFKSTSDLLDKLTEFKSLKSIEHEVSSKSNYLLNLKRSELQLILRTDRDFYKIPSFSLILLVFMEMTPLLCVLFPEITPSTCVLPSVSEKLHSSQSKAFNELAKLRKTRYEQEFYSKGQIPLRFNYENVPKDELLLLVKGLKLTIRYIPTSLYPEKYLRSKLHRKLQEFEIDNDYLLNQGGLWKLSTYELFKVCLDRGLFNFESAKKLTDLTVNELRLKIALQLVLVNNNVIGNVNIYGLNYLNLDTSPSFKDYTEKETEDLFKLDY